jgi:hypothetical protein
MCGVTRTTDELGGSSPNPAILAGGGRAVQRVSALKSVRLVALASSEPPAAAAVPAALAFRSQNDRALPP